MNKDNTISDKISFDITKKLNSEPVYNKNFLKIETKSYGDEATYIHDKEVPKVDSNYTCLAVISLDSFLKREENNYLQVFLKGCKYVEKK